jgi:ADP-heptose:LPS heptosyltransferase
MLLNWLYYHPVGHAVEAYVAAAEYRARNSQLEIHVIVNARAPHELVECCPWVSRCYPFDVEQVAALGEAAPTLAAIPRDWDYVVVSERFHANRPSYSPALLRCHELIERHCTARLWRGVRGDAGSGTLEAPLFELFAPFKMQPPPVARAWASHFRQSEPIFAVMLAGSSPEPIYPTLAWWKRMLLRLSDAFPRVRFLVTGATNDQSNRSTTHRYPTEELDALFASVPNSVNCYDVGFLNQLALIELADLFIAPHTGFAFLAPCLGTPWLTISGVRWPDPTYAHMPFYAVLPRCPVYPCFEDMLPECMQRLAYNQQVLCMAEALDQQIPAVVAGAQQLLDPAFDFAAAIARYDQAATDAGVERRRMYTLDMLRRYGGP